MKFKKNLKLEYGLKQIEVIPLINITLLMLVFFILTFGLIREPSFELKFPNVVTSHSFKPGILEIIITVDNSVYLDGKLLSAADIQSVFKQAATRREGIFIKVDRRASLDRLSEILGLAKSFGISQINIATSQK